jgi:hypothetical protein
MAPSNRSALLTRAHRVLKKHFKAVPPPADRPLLEQLLFACCLENARYESAEQAFAALTKGFFDWNEVRVSTVKELAEVVNMLPDPAAAAHNLKRVLQSAFEATYSFDLEALKKQSLGQAIGRLKKFEGSTAFVVSYVTQSALGGHAIPLDRGGLEVLSIIGAATEAEVASAEVAGLERAIAKSKGIEFGSLLHQLAAELVAAPYSPAVHKFLLEITPEAKARLPKRPSKKASVAPPPPPAPVAAQQKSGKAEAPKPEPAKKPAEKERQREKERPPAHAKKPLPEKKKPVLSKPTAGKAKAVAGRKSVAGGLAKRKPR